MALDLAFDATLKYLGAQLSAGDIDRNRYRRELAALLQQRLGCSRVGLWQIFGEAGARVMRCLARHDEGGGSHPGGEEIQEHEYGAYMERLVAQGVYISSDTLADAVLAPMHEIYFRPFDVRALMDAACTLNGQTFGVVCCEEIGRARTWTQTEVTQLKRWAAVIALHTARVEREPAWWDGPVEAA